MKLLIILIVVLITGCQLPHERREIERQQLERALADPSLTHEQKARLVQQSLNRRNDTGYRPVVDPASCKGCNYEGDLIQCRAVASDNTNYAGNTLGGAAAGAGAAALIGAIAGVDVGTMAAIGATSGAIGGLGGEAITHNQMIARCMQGRGYSVLR
jgi:hypothetical protein